MGVLQGKYILQLFKQAIMQVLADEFAVPAMWCKWCIHFILHIMNTVFGTNRYTYKRAQFL